MSDERLSEDEAFRAAFLFLKAYYERTRSDAVGGLLGDMSRLADGTTADPAAQEDWADAVRRMRDTPDEHYQLRLQP